MARRGDSRVCGSRAAHRLGPLARPLVALGIGFLALIFLGTALFGVCPLYTLLRINTATKNA
jgi:hypothetical protein